jgi:hypothetical protein
VDLTASFLSVINQSKQVHPLRVLRERQARREAGAQSLRASSLGRGSRAAEQSRGVWRRPQGKEEQHVRRFRLVQLAFSAHK